MRTEIIEGLRRSGAPAALVAHFEYCPSPKLAWFGITSLEHLAGLIINYSEDETEREAAQYFLTRWRTSREEAYYVNAQVSHRDALLIELELVRELRSNIDWSSLLLNVAGWAQ